MAVRDDKVIIRITPEVKERFQRQADRRGMTMSGLGAWVIGEFVFQQENNEKIQLQAMNETLDKLGPVLTKFVEDETDKA